jgi:integrase/recombinase XerC
VALERIDVHAIRRSVARLHAGGLSGRTLALTLSAWRGLYEWLALHHGYAANPCAGVRAPKAVRRLPQSLSPDGAAQLLDVVPEDPAEIRDKAMFELLYSSGLRLAELASLDAVVAGAVMADGEVTVTGKGSKTRTVPVGAHAIAALRAWMQVRPSLAKPLEKALFVGARGERIAHRVVQSRLQRWAAKSGLGEKVHPHALRHSFASHVLQSSGDLRAVQEMLGHASIGTTQVYTHLDFQYLAKAYDAAHPRARKK